MIDIHVRGDSTKETVDTNTKLSIFFVHGDELYNWTMFDFKMSESLNKVCNIHSKIYKHDESNFFFIENKIDEKGEIFNQKIKKVEIGFSFSNSLVVY